MSDLEANDRRAFVQRRVMSLCGVVPLGVFTLAHLLAMAQAFRGPEAFSGALARLTPLRLGLEAFLIGVPLLLHAGIGLSIATRARPNVGRYPYSGNHAWALQRASGVVVLLFVLAHLWEYRVKVLLGQSASPDFHADLVASLSSTGPAGLPVYAAGYLVGVAATVYHLVNGVAGFSASFGLVSSARALRRVQLCCGVLGALLFLLSAATVIHLATGTASPWGGS